MRRKQRQSAWIYKKYPAKNCKQLSAGKNNQQQDRFKEQVFEALIKQFGDNVSQNYQLGGFNLDIVILKENQAHISIDFENTENYHPEIAYRIKLHQQQILHNYGIRTHHLWSYNWWKDRNYEMDQIIKLQTNVWSFIYYWKNKWINN